MKKTIFALFCITLTFLICSCGHKSDAELTDIGQFRCQDSIQIVFDVLGETELETGTFGGEYFNYENLNLWGYNGEVAFWVRDNKETIKRFECNLELNKKEFEDVLSQLEDRYGKCEKHEYSEQIAYVWEFSEDEAEDVGYNEISLSDYGNKKVCVEFSDKWLNIKDEAYYKYLDEKNKTEILADKTYEIGEDTFRFIFERKADGYNFPLVCHVKDKSDAFWAHMSLNAIMNSQDEILKAFVEDMNFSYCIIIGDGAVLMRTQELFSITKDGEVLKTEEYFSPSWMLNESDNKNDYGKQVTDFMVDFIEKEYKF